MDRQTGTGVRDYRISLQKRRTTGTKPPTLPHAPSSLSARLVIIWSTGPTYSRGSCHSFRPSLLSPSDPHFGAWGCPRGSGGGDSQVSSRSREGKGLFGFFVCPRLPFLSPNGPTLLLTQPEEGRIDPVGDLAQEPLLLLRPLVVGGPVVAPVVPPSPEPVPPSARHFPVPPAHLPQSPPLPCGSGPSSLFCYSSPCFPGPAPALPRSLRLL